MRLTPLTPSPAFDVLDIRGARVRLADYRGRRVLLAFHRFAACPLCNLRVRRLVLAHDELEAAGLSVLAFFQSPREVIAQGVGRQEAPFPILPDPDMEVYARYGVESSRSALWRASVRRLPDAVNALTTGLAPRLVDGDPNLVPASFLIDEAGIIAETYYGRDIGDHLPLERVIAFATGGASASEVQSPRSTA